MPPPLAVGVRAVRIQVNQKPLGPRRASVALQAAVGRVHGFETYSLDPIVRRLRQPMGSDGVSDLVEDAIRLGHSDARERLRDDSGDESDRV